jgi:flagellar basal body-associated protein FliL
MRLLLALAVCLSVAVAPPLRASSGSSEEKPAAAGDPERTIGTPGIPTIDMPPLIAPMIVNGELHHYVHFSVSLKLTDDNHKTLVLEKVPYLQDAFLREVHRASIALDNNPDIVDEKGLIARLVALSAKVLGPDVVKDVEFKSVVRSS